MRSLIQVVVTYRMDGCFVLMVSWTVVLRHWVYMVGPPLRFVCFILKQDAGNGANPLRPPSSLEETSVALDTIQKEVQLPANIVRFHDKCAHNQRGSTNGLPFRD